MSTREGREERVRPQEGGESVTDERRERGATRRKTTRGENERGQEGQGEE